MKLVSRFALVLLSTSALAVGGLAHAASPINILPAAPQGEAAPAAIPVAPIPAAAVKAAPKAARNNNISEPKSPVAKPLSAWLVGPSMASQFDVKEHPDQQGCLMVTEYDNGMIVGIHARAAGIVGMTVDTKQATMEPGSAQLVSMNVGSDAYVLDALASDATTLSIGLEKAGGGRKVSERLTGLGNFRLMINEKPYYFSTTGFTDGLARLQACMGGTMAVTMPVTGPNDLSGKVTFEDAVESKKVTSSGNKTPIALAMPELVPAGYRFVLQNVDPMTPISWQAGDDWSEVMRKALTPNHLKMVIKDNVVNISQRVSDEPVVELEQTKDQEVAEVKAVPPHIDDDIDGTKPADMPEGVWSAAKGENLADVVDAWGLMAGVKVKADLQGEMKLPQDVRFEGRFDDAVEKLLGMFGGRNRPVGKFRGTSLASALSSPAPVAVRQIVKATPARTGDVPAPVGWKPRSTAELREMAKQASDKWAAQKKLSPNLENLKQMATVPDPADAPKVAKPDTIPAKAPVKTTWKALEGTSLRDVLEHWGENADVKVVWMSDQTFPLPDTYSKKGYFEEAVSGVLAQYKGAGVQPVVQLNQDPKTGEKALIIKTKNAGTKG